MDEEPDYQCYFCQMPLVDGLKTTIRGYTLCMDCALNPLTLGLIE